jgi:hypothetical protein
VDKLCWYRGVCAGVCGEPNQLTPNSNSFNLIRLSDGVEMKKLLVAAVAALLVSQASANEEYERGTFLCVSEMSTGFKVINGEWGQVNFHPGNKYIVRPMREGDRLHDPSSEIPAYGVFKFGEDYISAVDKNGFGFLSEGQFKPSTDLLARGLGFESFQMNKETMRFINSYLEGWVYQSPDAEQTGGDTPSIEIGSCSRI